MFVYADALETATWGLVVATALLVVAAAIPAIGAMLDRRRSQLQRLAAIIPDLHLLRSRVNGAIKHYDDDHATDDEIRNRVVNIEGMQRLLVSTFDAGLEEGLELTNELYICRHLLTQANHEYTNAVEKDPRDKSESLRRGVLLLIAARTTIDAIEGLLPQKKIKVQGERFWDRFIRVAEEREKAAEGKRLRDLGA
jgi:predicted Zn-dependent protease